MSVCTWSGCPAPSRAPPARARRPARAPGWRTEPTSAALLSRRVSGLSATQLARAAPRRRQQPRELPADAHRRAPSARRRDRQRDRGGAHAERAQQRDRDAHDEQHAEAADHRHGREQQHQHRGGAGRGRRRDRRPAGAAARARAPARRRAWRRARRLRRRCRALGLLLHARLELDRVVDGEPDEHRQHRDRGHRQRRPDGRQRAERERRGEQRQRERQQPRAPGEDEPERRRHHQQHGDQQQLDRVADRAGQIRDDHRLAGHEVALAVREPPLRHRHRLADQPDRSRPLRFGEPGLHPHRDQRRVAAREQVGEARLRRARGLGRVEHDVRDEVRVFDARPRVQPVFERERHEARLEFGLSVTLLACWPSTRACALGSPRASAAW